MIMLRSTIMEYYEGVGGRKFILSPATTCDANDDRTVQTIVDITNDAYKRGEVGMWKDDADRTNTKEVKDILTQGRLILCHEKIVGNGDKKQKLGPIVGSIMVNSEFEQTKSIGELGMLAVSRQYLRLGIGRALVNAAEKYCSDAGCKTIRLELLEPSLYKHEFKVMLDSWYSSLGYVRGESEDFAELYTELAPLLACPCSFTVYLKPLSPVEK